MSIFQRFRHMEELGDEALLAAAAQAAPDEAEAAPEPAADRPAEGGCVLCDELGHPLMPPLEQELAELRWQQAVRDTYAYWPQLEQEVEALIHKMAEISARYGDDSLWQRWPGGIMREAAIELFGLPQRSDPQLLQQAVRRAHEQGQRSAEQQCRSKSGLRPQLSRHGNSAPSAEEEIIREMRGSRHHGIF